MSTLASSAYDAVATALQSIIATEFAAEGYSAIRDNIHESLGRDRVDIGIAPIEETPRTGNAILQETYVEVRFYDLWTDEITPDTVIDPTRIAAYARRFKDACRRSSATDPGTGEVWYFSVERITYPNDPTGNKSRFHATVRAYGNNTALVETSG